MGIKNKNQITPGGKFAAGAFLIVFTALPIILIIGLWPDQMPEPKGPQLYDRTLFHVSLLKGDTIPADLKTFHINTILFLLVAFAGFMGSMIHLASSFTNYIGSEQFKRSWLLWYFVKPFTAAGVALTFYFVLKAGLLNFDAGGGVNPYGMVILAALAGLFTDKATIKLEEIFTTLFKPKDDRPDKLDAEAFAVESFEPKILELGRENRITINGKGLDTVNTTVKVGETEITEEDNKKLVTPTLISFQYKIDPVAQDQKEFPLTIIDENGTLLFKELLKVQEVTVPDQVEEEDAVG